ncbi:MAG TPA: ethanolamine ammonia-lyase subunit EutC [Gemmataceae bacterium]|nr:ethanolamine ammonia-lyase subunit EutC [Gemmataceae bacterium]
MSDPLLPAVPPDRRPPDLPPALRAARARTPARILVGRAGPSYPTATQLGLRQDHAAALDAVHAELDLGRDLGRDFVGRWQLFEVQTQAAGKVEYLMRPDLGRRLSSGGRSRVERDCPAGADVQVIIGDGLSVAAVAAQVPKLLPLLADEVRAKGWTFGRPFVVRHCRVGVLNEVGELLDPAVAVLLLGERPGLATAESLSAYLAYRPRPGHTDAQRNLISNIHARGVSAGEAARRIVALAEKMRLMQASGVAVKEELPAASGVDRVEHDHGERAEE